METMARQRECTAQEGERWQRRYSEGYQMGKSDARWNQPARIQIIPKPPELPYECGSQYVARHVSQAWEIGYSDAWRFAHR